MPERRLADLVAGCPDLRIVGEPDTQITSLTYDSREVRPGSLFVALRGGYFDGHDYIGRATAAGAAAVLAESAEDCSIPVIVAADSREALARVAANFYGHPSRELQVIGITGTDGKTSTSYLVEWMLRHAGIKTGMIGTVSVRIGGEAIDHSTRQTTPESSEIQRLLRQMVDAGVGCAIIEATSHGLDLHRLDAMQFNVGAVTNITLEHLEHHKTIAAYRRAKAILFERVDAAEGIAVVNLDDEGAREMLGYVGGARVITYGIESEGADIRAEGIELRVDGSRFDLVTRTRHIPVALPMLGGFNVANALCAAAIAVGIGIDVDHVVAAMETAPPIPGRMTIVDEGQPFSVVVDYAHTPESLTKVLALLKTLNPTGRIIAVSGSAGERDVEKRPLQGAASARYADFSVFTTEDPRFEDPDTIIEQIALGAIRQGASRGEDFRCVTDRREAIGLAFDVARPGDTVLLAGKGHETSIIWGLEKRPWDEEAVARELLGARRGNQP